MSALYPFDFPFLSPTAARPLPCINTSTACILISFQRQLHHFLPFRVFWHLLWLSLSVFFAEFLFCV